MIWQVIARAAIRTKESNSIFRVGHDLEPLPELGVFIRILSVIDQYVRNFGFRFASTRAQSTRNLVPIRARRALPRRDHCNTGMRILLEEVPVIEME